MICIAYRRKANMGEVIRTIWNTKQRKIIQDEGIVCSKITCYKLRNNLLTTSSARVLKATELAVLKNSSIKRSWSPGGHYIRESMKKKLEIVAGAGLRSGQRCGSAMADTMENNLPDTVSNVMQTDYWNSTPGIDKSCHVIRGWSKAFQLSS